MMEAAQSNSILKGMSTQPTAEILAHILGDLSWKGPGVIVKPPRSPIILPERSDDQRLRWRPEEVLEKLREQDPVYADELESYHRKDPRRFWSELEGVAEGLNLYPLRPAHFVPPDKSASWSIKADFAESFSSHKFGGLFPCGACGSCASRLKGHDRWTPLPRGREFALGWLRQHLCEDRADVFRWISQELRGDPPPGTPGKHDWVMTGGGATGMSGFSIYTCRNCGWEFKTESSVRDRKGTVTWIAPDHKAWLLRTKYVGVRGEPGYNKNEGPCPHQPIMRRFEHPRKNPIHKTRLKGVLSHAINNEDEHEAEYSDLTIEDVYLTVEEFVARHLGETDLLSGPRRRNPAKCPECGGIKPDSEIGEECFFCNYRKELPAPILYEQHDFTPLPMYEAPKACDCEVCRSMCKRPCWPTPQDAKKLMDLGYGDRLMIDYWAPDDFLDHTEILVPAFHGLEKDYAPSSMSELFRYEKEVGCNFLTAGGHCEIHSICKPTEGHLASCKGTPRELHLQVAQTWDTPEAKALVERWKEEFLGPQ